MDGSEQDSPFSYFFWDAYFKNMLPHNPEIDLFVKSKLNELSETHLGLYVDSFLYSRDLWTYIGYKYVFTIWTPVTAKGFMTRREYFNNSFEDFIDSTKVKLSRDERYLTLDLRIKKSGMDNNIFMANLRGQIAGWTEKDSSGKVVEAQYKWERWRKSYLENMPLSQKQKTLIAVLWTNPRFIEMLEPTEREEYDFLVPHAVKELEKMGYNAIAIGQNYDPEDFETSFHYVDTGGAKLAFELGSVIRDLQVRHTETKSSQ